MTEVRIVRLSLTNFKGIQSINIDFEKDVTDIYGDNATGKTTLMDAFLWVLFGKDSQNRADFNIKTLDQSGMAFSRLEHEVVLDLSVNGLITTFRRCYKENWVKKRGSIKETMEGHVVEYSVDDIPLGKREYDSKVAAICPEQLFKLITNPAYFPSLKMQEQRKILFEIVGGDITNGDVFDALVIQNKDMYSPLISALNAGKSLDEYKKKIVSQKNKAKAEVVDIPGRIEENNRNIPKTEDWSALLSEIAEKEKQIKEYDSLIADQSKSDQEQTNYRRNTRKLIDDKYDQVETIKRTIRTDANKDYDKWYSQLSSKKSELSKLIAEIKEKELQLENDRSALLSYQEQRESLIVEYRSIQSSEFKVDENSLCCPTCNRAFDGEVYDLKLEEMRTAFSTEKARLTNVNVSKGTTLKSRIEEVETRITLVDESLVEKKAYQNKLEVEIQQLQNDEPQKGDIETLISDNKEINDLVNDISGLEKSLKDTIKPTDISKYSIAKEGLQKEIYDLKDRYSKKSLIESTQKRITELSTQLSVMQQQIADYEQIEAAILDFMKAKVSLVEKRINASFSYVQFKMFDTQVDGTEYDTCECMVGGTPYSDLNTAAKMNAGIDIINAICKAKGITAPIWLDNRESVCELIPSKSQIINLFVVKGQPLTIQ